MQGPQTALVTGAAGFVGAAVTRRLIAAGVRVLALDDLSAGDLARLESARKHAALALYHVTRRPDLAARVVDAGGRRAMRALKSEAASEETRALAEMCLGALENAA